MFHCGDPLANEEDILPGLDRIKEMTFQNGFPMTQEQQVQANLRPKLMRGDNTDVVTLALNSGKITRNSSSPYQIKRE